MPVFKNVKVYDITAGGGTTSIATDDGFDSYIIGADASVTLAASQVYSVTGTLYEGCTFDILYKGNIVSDTSGGKVVTFFGTDLTDAQAATQLRIVATYSNGAWSVGVLPYSIFYVPSIWGSQIVDDTLSGTAFPDGKIDVAKLADLTGQGYIIVGGGGGAISQLDASGNGYMLIGDGTDLNSVPSSGDVTVDSTGAFTIGADKVVTAMILNDNVTVNKVSSALKSEVVVLNVAFETGELGDYKIKMPYPGTVSEIYARVTKAIAGTDDATITPKNNGGTTMTDGVITFTASDAFGTAETSTPSANNTFVAGDLLTFTTAKTTAGGRVQISLKITRS